MSLHRCRLTCQLGTVAHFICIAFALSLYRQHSNIGDGDEQTVIGATVMTFVACTGATFYNVGFLGGYLYFFKRKILRAIIRLPLSLIAVVIMT